MEHPMTLEIGSWPSSFAKATADRLEIHYGAELRGVSTRKSDDLKSGHGNEVHCKTAKRKN